MRCIETGKVEGKTFHLKWNECLFVDIWDNYHLYTECASTSFDLRLRRYIETRQRTINYFCENYIRKIEKGKS